jgi:hypothetical protein
MGFGADFIALRQSGAKQEGFIRYVLSNPTPFDTTDRLIGELRELVRNKRWSPKYSRNLVVNPTFTPTNEFSYTDVTGQSVQKAWLAEIQNHRLDAAAVGTICILDSVQNPSGKCDACKDRSYLKWAGLAGYERTIFPKSSDRLVLFVVRHDQKGLFLQSELDVHPREPIVTENGHYELTYKLFARDFPLLEFRVHVHLRSAIAWTDQIEAYLKV